MIRRDITAKAPLDRVGSTGSRFTPSCRLVLAGALLAAALAPVAAHGWQADGDHAAHQPATAPDSKKMAGMKAMDMKASNAKLDELVAKMNAAQGQPKVDAIAELLTTLVQQHKSMHGDMGQMMSTMKGAAAAK